MLRIKVFTYCSDFQIMVKIKVQKSKSNYLNNNNKKYHPNKDFVKQNKIIEFS